MNILTRELKNSRKTFLFWSIGLFLLVFAGITKYTGVGVDGGSISEIIEKFPRIVLAVFGITDVNIESLGGYYALLCFYTGICASIYAISLGSNAVNRESIDKTYEFIFTKPRTRTYILMMKIVSAYIYLALFALLNYVFSLLSLQLLNFSEDITKVVGLFSFSILLVSFLFFSVSVFICSLTKESEKGSLYSNLFFIATFIIGIFYDMSAAIVLRFLSPLKYFLPVDVLRGRMSPFYICVILLSCFLLTYLSARVFNKKDLNQS